MITTRSKKTIHNKRVARIRAKVIGTALRPRLSVFRSNTRLSVQCVDDEQHSIVFSLRAAGKNSAAAKKLAGDIVSLAAKKHIKQFVFDRGGYKYHGVIKTLADSVREGGITI